MRIVLTSVRYADFLAVTLPAWRALVPSGLLVATSPEDEASQRIAADHNVPTVITDAWRRSDRTCHQGDMPRFNLALGLDVAFGLFDDAMPPPAEDELCGHLSADCYPVGRWPADRTFPADTIAGFWRYACATPAELRDAQQGRRAVSSFPRLKNAHGWPIGYCQLFRYRSGLRFGSFPTAGKFDIRFREQFTHKVMRDDVALLHLGPSSVRENWAGRVIPQWGAA